MDGKMLQLFFTVMVLLKVVSAVGVGDRKEIGVSVGRRLKSGNEFADFWVC